MEKGKAEDFIRKAKLVHGDTFGYNLVEYINSKEKVVIVCKTHGEFTQTPNSHLKRQGCKKCGTESMVKQCTGSLNQFIEKSKTIHGNRYDYSKVNYINSLTKVTIRCEKHGDFEQTPKIHYKANCPKCGREAQTKKARKSEGQFIQEARDIHGDSYDYTCTNYINSRIKVDILCKTHGVFKVTPQVHLEGQGCIECTKPNRKIGVKPPSKCNDKSLFIARAFEIYGNKDDYTDTVIVSARTKFKVTCKKHNHIFEKDITTYLNGHGCPKCSAENYSEVRTKTTQQFITQAMEVHGDKYDYTETAYKTCRTKVDIICKLHGKYSQTANNHLAGNGCTKCFTEDFKYNIYFRDGYISTARGRTAIVYVIKCTGDGETFYKIGKTVAGLSGRFCKSNLPYDYEEICTIESDAGTIYDLEIELHKLYKEYNYTPNKSFAGHTECYNINLPTDTIRKWQIQVM